MKTCNPDENPSCMEHHDRSCAEYGSCDPWGSCSCFGSCCLSSFFKSQLQPTTTELQYNNHLLYNCCLHPAHCNHTQDHIHETKSNHTSPHIPTTQRTYFFNKQTTMNHLHTSTNTLLTSTLTTSSLRNWQTSHA